jgi:hypothetical protein
MELVGDLPHVRVTLGSDNITVTGSVNIASEIRVNNTELQSIPVHLTSNIDVGNFPAFPTSINVGNFPAFPTSINVGNFPAIPTSIDVGNFPAFPTIYKVSKDSNDNTTSNRIYVDAKVSNTDPIAVTGNLTATVTGGTIETVVKGASSVSAFGEPFGLTITPVIQLDSIYGITDDVIQTYHSGTGSGASANPLQALFTVNTGTDAYGYGVLRSKRFIRYRPGQGALCRFTAAFTPNIALTSQRAGLFNQENAIMVGWNDDGTGPKFGVMRATGGKADIHQLTINSITTGSQTITITLNGVPFNNITVNTADTAIAASIIATRLNGYTGWLVDQVDNTIVFLANSLGAKSGTYSITSTGTISGTFAQLQIGVAQTEHWTYQKDFNVDKLGYINPLTGTKDLNPSGMTIATEHLNVFQINFRWLGVGEIRYALENQITGELLFFHREHYTNQYNLPHVANPSFKIGYVAYSLGSTTNTTVSGVCMMGAIEGEIKQNELNRSTQSVKAGLVKDLCHHLLTIRNPYVTNGSAGALNGNYILNAKEILLKDVSVGVQGNDPGILYVFYNASSLNTTHVYRSQPKDNGMVSVVDGQLNYLIDTAVSRFITAINGESRYQLDNVRVAIPPGDSITFAIQSSSALNRVSLAVVFSED